MSYSRSLLFHWCKQYQDGAAKSKKMCLHVFLQVLLRQFYSNNIFLRHKHCAFIKNKSSINECMKVNYCKWNDKWLQPGCFQHKLLPTGEVFLLRFCIVLFAWLVVFLCVVQVLSKGHPLGPAGVEVKLSRAGSEEKHLSVVTQPGGK